MGLIRGSGSFTRYHVNGKVDDTEYEEIERRITRNSFIRLDENGSEERATGWVNVLNVYDNCFEGRDFLMYPYIALSWRVDVRKVPKTALTQQYIEAETEIREREELEFIPKERKKEIKEFLRQRLIKRAIPNTSTYDMIWNIDTSTILFGSTNVKLCDEFSEFFTRTFEFNLTPVFPYSLACSFLDKQGLDVDLLEGLKGSQFYGGK